mmetsp:Transcript_97416/g.135405  ORF Transcript_97416/g.135405 Transcript_97416/m.135405 type:complete len:229 (-) Transcript_97416:48-734(-)
MGLLCLLRGCHLSSSNGPNRLVGQDHLLPIILGQDVRQRLQLLIQHVKGFAALSGIKLLADAGKGAKALVHGELGLLCHDLAGLSAVFAALGMAQDHPLDAHVAKHLCWSLASPGSWVLIPKVLCSHRVVLTQSSLHLGEEDERRSAHHLDILGGHLTSIQLLNERLDAVRAAVGLPVATHNELPLSLHGHAVGTTCSASDTNEGRAEAHEAQGQNHEAGACSAGHGG